MRAPSIGTALRLTRIAALVLACLLFLHACDRTRRLLPTDVWLEFGAAIALAAGAMVAAWFEIARAERIEEQEELEANDPPAPRADDLIYDTATHAVRARIAASGNLVVHGRERGGSYPSREWSWTFRTGAFPAIRAVLGGDDDADVLELLEEVIPELDPDSRTDPGAWLRANGVAGTYREKGDNPTRTTHKLPILRPGGRRGPAETGRASKAGSDGRSSAAAPRRGRRAGTERESAAGPAAPRSGPDRRVDADRLPPARRRSGDTRDARVSAPDSGPLGAGRDATRRRAGAHSGPFPAAGPEHGRPASGTRRRAGDTGVAPTRRTRRDSPGRTPDAEVAARPDLPRRTRQPRAADDQPPVSLHGRRSSPPPPEPGLFSARTGIDPGETASPPPLRARTRPPRADDPLAEAARERGGGRPSRARPFRDHGEAAAENGAPGEAGYDAADPRYRRGRRHR